jgi:plasmid stabilization system protein ParE
MTKLRFVRDALQDLEAALAWYEARSPEAARRFCEAIDVGLDLILSAPEMYPRWDERQYYYLVQRYPYNILYRVDPGIVTIAAIRHTSRNDSPSFGS